MAIGGSTTHAMCVFVFALRHVGPSVNISNVFILHHMSLSCIAVVQAFFAQRVLFFPFLCILFLVVGMVFASHLKMGDIALSVSSDEEGGPGMQPVLNEVDLFGSDDEQHLESDKANIKSDADDEPVEPDSDDHEFNP